MIPKDKVQIYFCKRNINNNKKRLLVYQTPCTVHSKRFQFLYIHRVTKANFPNNSIHDPKSLFHYSIKDSIYSLTELNEYTKRYNYLIKA